MTLGTAPFNLTFSFENGLCPERESSKRTLSDVKNIFYDIAEAEKLLVSENPLIYEFYELPMPQEDGDLAFEENYFEFQLTEFSVNPKLGMTSGTTYNVFGDNLVIDKMPEDHVRGAAKMYRTTCFDQIGGPQIVLGWDTLDELKAQMLGWETKSYKNLVLKHYKPIGFKQKKTARRELLAGERLNYLGYHPLFAILKCLYNIKRKPYIVGGILMLAGYLGAVISGSERNPDREMIRFYRKKQMKRLSGMVGFSN